MVAFIYLVCRAARKHCKIISLIIFFGSLLWFRLDAKAFRGVDVVYAQSAKMAWWRARGTSQLRFWPTFWVEAAPQAKRKARQIFIWVEAKWLCVALMFRWHVAGRACGLKDECLCMCVCWGTEMSDRCSRTFIIINFLACNHNLKVTKSKE